MKQFSAEIHIDAPPEVVWNILTDASTYTSWDPNMVSIEGPIEVGQTLRVKTKLSSQTFTPTVKEAEVHRSMIWASSMPFGLFKGVRTFTLEPRDGGTYFHTQETFSGPMMVLIGGTIPDMTDVFQAFAAGLKAYAEKTT